MFTLPGSRSRFLSWAIFFLPVLFRKPPKRNNRGLAAWLVDSQPCKVGNFPLWSWKKQKSKQRNLETMQCDSYKLWQVLRAEIVLRERQVETIHRKRCGPVFTSWLKEWIIICPQSLQLHSRQAAQFQQSEPEHRAHQKREKTWKLCFPSGP